MFAKGVALDDLNRPQDAIAVYDALIARFGEESGAEIREQVAWAMIGKGESQGKMNRSEDAIAAYDALITRFGSVSEPEIRKHVAKAKQAKEALAR